MSAYLTEEQLGQLIRPINGRRVNSRDGMAYLEAYDVRAHLTRLFGFARWSADVLDCELLFEDLHEIEKSGQKKPVVSVGYRSRLRLVICAPDGTELATYTEVACGAASNFPMSKRADAHDFAAKTSESQALKRCAINLGDQFGLSLYRKGSVEALVMATLVHAVATAESGVDDDAPDVEAIPEGVDPETGEILSEVAA